MGRESNAWSSLRDRVKVLGLHTERLTDRIQDGLPDVLWVHKASRMTGLLETKAIAAWPKRSSTGVKVDFRPSQPVWLYKWTLAGGRGAVLTRVTDARVWVFNPAQRDPAWVHDVTADILSVEHRILPDKDSATMLINLLLTLT